MMFCELQAENVLFQRLVRMEPHKLFAKVKPYILYVYQSEGQYNSRSLTRGYPTVSLSGMHPHILVYVVNATICADSSQVEGQT